MGGTVLANYGLGVAMGGDELISVMLNFATPQKYAHGGLAGKAKEVRDAGRGGDTMLVHVNPIEYKWLKEHFGPGGINPKTGMPEFSFLDWIIPAVSTFLLPGVGTALGTAFSTALGGGELVSSLAPFVGNALLGGGVNALTGGDFATGAIAGGLAPSVGGALGLNQGVGLLSNLGLNNPLAAATYSGPKGIASMGLNAAAQGAAQAAAATPLQSLTSGLLKAAPLLLTASALTKKQEPPQQGWAPGDTNAQHLSNVKFERPQTAYKITSDYGTKGGETTFFTNNRLPDTSNYSHGNYVKGGGTGTSDDIPAKLSDGEYVIDAQTVSMLGDGSSDAGAKKLDHMRKEIRKQKGAALSQGKFAPNAKNPLSYIKRA